jgi:hypothetical protein
MARPATPWASVDTRVAFYLASISAYVERPRASKRDSDARHRRRYYPGASAFLIGALARATRALHR